jgi:prepilin-type N-terminal cleavage/methylation domain-containing protein
MNYNKMRKNKNKGFSLVELIVVIAIMAVMVVVLAPTLLQYVERSRAQRDDSAMGELTNVVKIAISDEDVYDEVLYYSAKNNVSCYIDREETADGVTKLYPNPLDAGADSKNYNYGDELRQKDEVEFTPAGMMRGMTITFEPTQASGTTKFVLGNGKINALAASINGRTLTYTNGTPASGNMTLMTTKAYGSDESHYLYNRIRESIGSEIELVSRTYRNSDYTIFIRMGSTGGTASSQDAIAVYGQWNGTNVPVTE